MEASEIKNRLKGIAAKGAYLFPMYSATKMILKSFHVYEDDDLVELRLCKVGEEHKTPELKTYTLDEMDGWFKKMTPSKQNQVVTVEDDDEEEEDDLADIEEVQGEEEDVLVKERKPAKTTKFPDEIKDDVVINTASDLRIHLFDMIKGLKNGTVKVEEAKASANIAQVILNSFKTELEILKFKKTK